MKYITAIPRVIWAIIWWFIKSVSIGFVLMGWVVVFFVETTPLKYSDPSMVLLMMATVYAGAAMVDVIESNRRDKP